MGQKIHPGGLRVGVIHDWKSNWYTGTKDFAGYILEDIKIREHIYKKLAHAGLSDILIRKDKQRITVDIYTARPGIVIGKSGVEVDALRRELHALTQKNVHININEIKLPELNAKLVAQSIAEQLENRVSFRRAMKRALASAMRSGAQGDQDPLRRPAGRRRDEPLRDATREGACRCTRSAPTSTTARRRPRRPSAASASRSGSTRASSCPRATRRSAARRGWAARTRRGAAAASRASASAGPRRSAAGRPSARAWAPSGGATSAAVAAGRGAQQPGRPAPRRTRGEAAHRRDRRSAGAASSRASSRGPGRRRRRWPRRPTRRTPVTQHEAPQKLDQSGDPSAEKTTVKTVSSSSKRQVVGDVAPEEGASTQVHRGRMRGTAEGRRRSSSVTTASGARAGWVTNRRSRPPESR